MKSDVELVVIGDESVRRQVYDFMSKPLDKFAQNTGRVFPGLRASDSARDRGASTSTGFTFGAQEIRYHIQTQTNEGEFSSDDRSVLTDNLTVLVCIDFNSEIANDWAKDRFDNKINELIAIRNKRFFNIVPVVLSQVPVVLSQDSTDFPSVFNYSLHTFGSDILLNNPSIEAIKQFRMIPYNISLATPIYNQVQHCLELLETRQYKVSPPALRAGQSLLEILSESSNITGNFDTTLRDALKSYFNDNREGIQTAFRQMKQALEGEQLPQNSDIGSIFINILCSVAAIFASLTIIGIPFVYYALSQNSKYHNNCFKFFATNDIDKERASIVKVEDEVNRCLLSFS